MVSGIAVFPFHAFIPGTEVVLAWQVLVIIQQRQVFIALPNANQEYTPLKKMYSLKTEEKKSHYQVITPKVCPIVQGLKMALYQDPGVRYFFEACFPLRQLVNSLTFRFPSGQQGLLQRSRYHCFQECFLYEQNCKILTNCYFFPITLRYSNLILNLFSLMVDANIPDIALEPDKTVKKVISIHPRTSQSTFHI